MEKVDLEEARRLANILLPIPTTHMGLYKIQVGNAQAAIGAFCQEVERLRELVGILKDALERIRPVPTLLLQHKAVRNLDEIYAECDNALKQVKK